MYEEVGEADLLFFHVGVRYFLVCFQIVSIIFSLPTDYLSFVSVCVRLRLQKRLNLREDDRTRLLLLFRGMFIECQRLERCTRLILELIVSCVHVKTLRLTKLENSKTELIIGGMNVND